MASMLDDFRSVLSTVTFSKPKYPIVSNVSGKIITPNEDVLSNPEYWISHIRGAVQWHEGVKNLQKEIVNKKQALLFVEVGPQPILLGMTKSALSENSTWFLPTLRKNTEDRLQITETIAK